MCVCVYSVFMHVCIRMRIEVYIFIYKFIYAHMLLINKDEERMGIIKDCALHLEHPAGMRKYPSM